MSEQINFNHENNEVPTRDEVLDAFISKRASLESQLNEINAKPGFKKNATDKVYDTRDRRELSAQLEGLNEEWYALGGEAIEEANKAQADLNFKSDATDHVRVNAQIRDAKDSFYENFLASEEVAVIEAEADAQQDMLASMPAATTNPANTISNRDRDAVKPEVDNTTSEPDFITLPNGMKIEVRRVNGQLSMNLIDRVDSGAAKNEADETGEESDVDSDSEANAEVTTIDTRSKSQKAFAEAGKFTRNPLAYFSARMATARAMRENGNTPEEKKSWRKKAVVAGLGVVGLAGAIVAAKHGMFSGGGNAHGQAADMLPQSGGNTHRTAAEALAAAPTKSAAHIEAGHDVLGSSIKIHRGEGFYEVFQKAGIPEKDWHATMDKVGPDLAKKGLAYWDKAHNEWRISGKLVEKSLAVSKGHVDLAA